MGAKQILPKRLAEETARFIEYTPAACLNKNLRRLLMNYLMFCQDAHGFNMDDLLLDMCNLMDYLDLVAEERGRGRDEVDYGYHGGQFPDCCKTPASLLNLSFYQHYCCHKIIGKYRFASQLCYQSFTSLTTPADIPFVSKVRTK
jgi:hypothetical protein